jgi:PAS domain-containing protein
LNQHECPERIRLIDEYCRAITDFNLRLDSLRSMRNAPGPDDWDAAEASRTQSQQAWEAVEQHIAAHKCMPLAWPTPEAGVLESAAMHAPDVILVVDDDRRYVDVNQAAAEALGLPRKEPIGRRVDEFFLEARGVPTPTAWASFVADGEQAGVCELLAPSRRRFAYRAKANFAPGFHLSILREIE